MGGGVFVLMPPLAEGKKKTKSGDLAIINQLLPCQQRPPSSPDVTSLLLNLPTTPSPIAADLAAYMAVLPTHHSPTQRHCLAYRGRHAQGHRTLSLCPQLRRRGRQPIFVQTVHMYRLKTLETMPSLIPRPNNNNKNKTQDKKGHLPESWKSCNTIL